MALESTDSIVDVTKKQRECFPSDRVAQLDEIMNIVNTTAPDWGKAASCADGIDYEIRCYIQDVPLLKWKWTDAEERCYGTLRQCVAFARTVNDNDDSVAECIRNLNSAITNLDTIRNAVRPDLTLAAMVTDMNTLKSECAEMTQGEILQSRYAEAIARLNGWVDQFERVKQSVEIAVLDAIDRLLTHCNDDSSGPFLMEPMIEKQNGEEVSASNAMLDRLEAVWDWVREQLAVAQGTQDLMEIINEVSTDMNAVKEKINLLVFILAENPPQNPEMVLQLISNFQRIVLDALRCQLLLVQDQSNS